MLASRTTHPAQGPGSFTGSILTTGIPSILFGRCMGQPSNRLSCSLGDGLRRCSRRSARNRPRRRSSTRVASDLAPRTPQTEFASSNKNGTINVVTTQLSGSGRSLGLQLAKHRRQANTGRTTQSSLYDINVVSMKMSYINVHMWLPVTERIRSHLPEITRILCMTPFGVDLVSPERETNGPLNPDVENAVRRRVYCPRPTTVYGALLDV